MKLLSLKKVCRPLLIAAMLFMVFGADLPDQNPAEVPDISQRINAFSMDLLKQRAAQDGQANCVLSPQSIFHGLAMSYIASGGETREELARVLHFPEQNDALIQDLSRLRQQLRETDKHKRIDLTMANSAWLDETHADFRKDYRRDIRNAFDGSLYLVEFKQAAAVSDRINEWIAEKTRGKIEKSVSPDDFASRSRPGVIDEPALVTANAVYFKADWGSRFDKDSTSKKPFHVDAVKTVETPMMHQLSLLSYSENVNLKFLELPYIDSKCSMYVILPKELTDVRQLMHDMTVEQVTDLRLQASMHRVDVLLPKFEMRSHLGAREALADMGVQSAFSREVADFDQMIIKKQEAFRIYISEIYHDAWIDVYEEGTEAAAATTTTHRSFGCSAQPVPMPAQFHADHPFLFMIVHNESRSILFAGWISNPEELVQQ